MREIKIAKILRPHGIKGGLKVSPLIDDIPFSSFGKVILGKAKIDTKITKIQPLKQFLIVYVDAVNDCNTAETFRNQYIMIDREKYQALFDDVVLLTDFIGCKVFTETGKELGVVVDATNYGSADIISINCGGTTYMVPYIKDTLHFDKVNKKFIINEQRFLEIRVWELLYLHCFQICLNLSIKA